MYPENDDQFKDETIEKVNKEKDGTYTITCDGWSLWCGKECAVTPEAGQTARIYGKGLGFQIRGLFINGVKVWYRTENEEKEYREIQYYGADAADWLKRWDEGESCWTIEMGGLGPGYEQCIHITCAEILRWMLENKPDASKWEDSEVWKADRERVEQYGFKNKVISALGLSGAQWGAALNIAAQLYKNGPRAIMSDERIKDRHIQVRKHFPQAA